MLEMLRSLVPFIEKGQGENIQTQMLRRAMELCKDGGFHCVFPEDGSQYFAVSTFRDYDRFNIMIYHSGSKSKRDDDCSIVRFNADGSRDDLHLRAVRLESIGSAQLFIAEHIGTDSTRRLKKKELVGVLKSFLSSEIDVTMTNLSFADIAVDDAEFIHSGQTVLEWVKDMKSESNIAGLLGEV